MIGNAHIDPVWLWQWPEGYQEVRATFQSAIDRHERVPGLRLHVRLVALLRVGRGERPGALRADPRSASPRAASRSSAAGGSSRTATSRAASRSCARRSTASATCARSSASPRRPARTSTRSGTTRRSRRSSRESGVRLVRLPAPGAEGDAASTAPLFWWESADGSRVLAYRIPHEYCAPKDDIGEHVEKAIASLPDERATSYAVFYGVGNHGGGPTIANLECIERLNERGDLPRLELSSLRRFFDRVDANGEIPTLRGELQHHARGCYTTHSGIKRWNRRAENLLLRAEKWCAIADVARLAALPARRARRARGSSCSSTSSTTRSPAPSIEPAYEDARDQLGHASSLAANAFNRAVQSIARQHRHRAGGGDAPGRRLQPAPVAAARRRRRSSTRGCARRARSVVDDEGDAGADAADAVADDDERRARAARRSRSSVPPLGYRMYRDPQGQRWSGESLAASDTRLENEHVLLELDARRAASRGSCSRRPASTSPRPTRSTPSSIDDRSDTWGHGVVAYDDEVGEFECESVRLLENGPVRSIVRVESRYGDSTLREDYVARRPTRRTSTCASTLDWHEQLKLLKLRYPTSVDDRRRRRSRRRTATSSGRPAATRSRASRGSTSPAATAGLTVVERREVRLRRPRRRHRHQRRAQPGLGVARPARARGRTATTSTWTRAGRRSTSGSSRTRATGATPTSSRRAAELNQPPFALIETFHDGPLPQRASFGDDGGGDVVVTVVKARRGRRRRSSCARTRRAGRAAHARIELLGRDDRGRLRRERDQDVRRAARRPTVARDRSARVVTRSTASWQLQGLARRRVALAREQAVGRARLAARARAGQRRRRPRARGRGARPVLRARTAGSRSGSPSARGSTARRVRGGDDRVRGRRPRGDGVRRRRGGRAPRRRVHAVRASTCREGEHLLAVAVHAAPESEAQVGRTSRVRVHKSRMGYGWDFCPRLVHQGIWRPVTLDPPPRASSRA